VSCAATPLLLLAEIQSILHIAANDLYSKRIKPAKVSATAALDIKKLSLAATAAAPQTNTLRIEHYLIGRKQYDTKAERVPLFADAVKVLKKGVPSLELSQSAAHKHGNQHINFVTGPVKQVLETATHLWNDGHVRKLTAADRTYYQSHKAPPGEHLVALGYKLEQDEAVTFLGVATLLDKHHSKRPEYIKIQTHLTRQAILRAMRTNLTLCISALTILALSVGGLALYHLSPAITFVQILALQLLVYVPIVALSHESTYHNFPHNKWHGPLAFGIITGLLGYGNYLFYFSRHMLDPAYIDPALPMHHQATTVALLTVLLCTFAYLLFERADRHKNFFTEHLHSNDKLLQAFGFSLVGFVAIAYLPPLQWLFSTLSLDVADWASAILAVCLYALIRLLQRHTRKHTRHAVLQLHHQVKG
jgi:hypothetical protein